MTVHRGGRRKAGNAWAEGLLQIEAGENELIQRVISAGEPRGAAAAQQFQAWPRALPPEAQAFEMMVTGPAQCPAHPATMRPCVCD